MTTLELRNKAWKTSRHIPNWVRGRENETGLDQFNTPPSIARYCWDSFQEFLRKDGVSLGHYTIVEPSAGTGTFYDLLPKGKRIGIDIEEYRKEYVRHDFLTWEPPKEGKFAIIGNPPFGYRGWLALAFVNRAAEFSDYIGFILPMSFQSDGKGSPKHRVEGMTLVHSEKLPDILFNHLKEGNVYVNTLWQIWKKGESKGRKDLKESDEYIELFTVDRRKERLCGQEKMKTCNTFLERTFYTNPPEIVNDFSEVRYGCGYGINVKKDKRKVLSVLKNIDWVKYSNLATHNCRHISMYHIKQALLDNLPKYANS